MRRLIEAGFAAFLIIAVAAGCSDDKKTVIPDKQIDVPKEGPNAVGGKGTKGGANPADAQPASSDQ